MIFVFGGAHQGRGEFVRSLGYARILEADEGGAIDFSAGAVRGLERWALGCVRRGESPVERFAALEPEWCDCALIGTDFSCGVVPMEPELRRWREENGRLNNYLAARAERVVRMFCGLPQELK